MDPIEVEEWACGEIKDMQKLFVGMGQQGSELFLLTGVQQTVVRAALFRLTVQEFLSYDTNTDSSLG